MVVDQNNIVVHMSADMAETYGAEEYTSMLLEQTPVELDEELGLPVVQKQTIFQKYGVHCDPNTNSFYASLHRQFEKNGSLSVKQVNALRK